MSGGMDKLREVRRRRSEDRFAERFATQFAQQWSQVRAERQQEAQAEPRIDAGPSNFSRAQVPWAVDLTAAWAWRFLVIAAAGWVLLWLVDRFSVIFLPLVVAMLITALASLLGRARGARRPAPQAGLRAGGRRRPGGGGAG
jgi:hypothetical protein